MDVFLSHSSADTAAARRTERALESAGLSVWLDRSEIRLGTLLRNELRQAIGDCCVMVVLWSKRASASPWVAGELLTAYHLDRFVLPCLLDRTRLPQFLGNSVQLDFTRRTRGIMAELVRGIREAPSHANPIQPVMRSESAELGKVIREIYQRQFLEVEAIGGPQNRAAVRAHAVVESRLASARRRWRYSHVLLNMAGYHAKNAYMIRHWDALQAGVTPRDRLLDRAQRFFFSSLFVDPDDFSALNGLGSILALQRELDAAEFFVRRAITLAEKHGVDYTAAKSDLALIESFRSAV